MAKSPDAFRTIREVAEWLDTPAHVLRFWESRFAQVKPVKRAGGRRYYRPTDMELLGGIKRLLHEDGLTIRGVQKLLREQGVRHVASKSQPLGLDPWEMSAIKMAEVDSVEEGNSSIAKRSGFTLIEGDGPIDERYPFPPEATHLTDPAEGGDRGAGTESIAASLDRADQDGYAAGAEGPEEVSGLDELPGHPKVVDGPSHETSSRAVPSPAPERPCVRAPVLAPLWERRGTGQKKSNAALARARTLLELMDARG